MPDLLKKSSKLLVFLDPVFLQGDSELFGLSGTFAGEVNFFKMLMLLSLWDARLKDN